MTINMISTNERPLENLVTDGGFCGIFRTIGCIGDSLSSGEFESTQPDGSKGYHDYYDYSWGQYLARMAGCKVFNFSRGGMSAEWYHRFADENGFWNSEYKCQAYILALGVNDLNASSTLEVGSLADIDLENYENNAPTFAGHYAKIIQKIKKVQPKARVFLMTVPRSPDTPEHVEQKRIKHAELLYQLAETFEFTYVMDFRKYAPVYDEDFRAKYYLGGHMNPAGYLLTAKFVASYMDYIIRQNPEDFAQVGFIGTEYHNNFAKW